MTVEEKIDVILMDYFKGGDVVVMRRKLAEVVDEACFAEKQRVLATDRARFHGNALLPTTWEYEALQDARNDAIYIVISGDGEDGNAERIVSIHSTKEGAEKVIGTYEPSWRSNLRVEDYGVEVP